MAAADLEGSTPASSLSEPVASGLPSFRFAASGLPDDEAFEAWRAIMARMFDIEPAADGLPRGGVSSVLVGDLMTNRSTFNVQRLTRDSRRIDATPDHLVLQFYGTGGFAGEIGGDSVRIARGQVAICDLRRKLDVKAAPSETIGLSIPRNLLDGVDFEKLPSRLDPVRERLLAARVRALHVWLPTLAASEVQAVTSDLLAALHRLFDPSTSADVLDAREFDADILTLAKELIAADLAAADLSPTTLAARLRVSRATLYRVFAPLGGVMRRVWDMRLEAVRAALDQPAAPRTLTRLAADHGFQTVAHLSRSFRARYGITPRDWRAQQTARSGEDWRTASAGLNACWRELGR